MNPFDLFTGKPAIKSARQERQFLAEQKDAAHNLLTEGSSKARGDIKTGTQGALAALGTGYGDATGAINTGADDALSFLDQGQDGALGSLGQARTDLEGAGEAYAPLSALGEKYGGASTMALNALGVNGAGGREAAVDAFQAGPGYEFALDQGIDSIARLRNAGGMLASGNADRDAQVYGQGLANQEYGGWLDRLSSFAPLELSATGQAAQGQAGIGRDMAGVSMAEADLYGRTGAARADIAERQGGNLADLASRFYGGEADLHAGQGRSLADIAANWGRGGASNVGTFAGPRSQTFSDEANAKMAGSANLWNFGMNAAKMLAGLPPGGGGGGMPGAMGNPGAILKPTF